MMKVERVLVATDFSAAGQRAVQTAAEWARREDAALRIVHAAPTARRLAGLWRTSMRDVHAVHRQAADALRRVVEAIDPARRLDVSTGLVTGPAARQVARAAVDYRADLLVIGARGEHETTTGQPGLGGTAIKLVGATAVPLLLARHAPAAPPKVLAAVDLTDVSSAVLQWASRCAVGGQLHVFHAYEVPFASRLEAYGVAAGTLDVYTADENEKHDWQLTSLIASTCPGREVHRITERGDAASRLLVHVQRLAPTVLVLGKHSSRPGRPVSTAHGSVCRHAAFFSPTDVLIVPVNAGASTAAS
jgi:nucleotide-binding universal stress UspA family protein